MNNTIKLMIKGNYQQSQRALLGRGIVGKFLYEKDDRSYWEVSANYIEPVINWFGESNEEDCKPGLGYPPGTLLYYTDFDSKC